MKHTQLFEDFLNEGKSFQFSFNYNTDEDDVEYIQNILMNAGVDAIAEPGIDSEEMVVKALNAVELRKAKKAIQSDGFEINESEVNEGINVKDIKVGTILNFKDGETWKVTKTSGISSGKIFAAPYGDTKKSYVSLPIEFSIENLENDVKSLNESQEFISESSIGDIHIMAIEADSFTAFRKEFMDEYGKPKSVKELKQLEAWLQTIWNENQTNENNMKYTTTFEGFVNESKKEKMSSATYWEEVTIPNVGSNNTVKANNDSTKAAQALVSFWEKGKSPEAAGFTVRDIVSLDLSKAKTGDVITCKFIDGKTDKDYLIRMEVRDTLLGVPNKNIYTWVSRV